MDKETVEAIEELMRNAISEALFGIKSPFYGKGIVEEVAVEQMKIALQSQTQDIIKKVEKIKETGPEENCRYDMPHPRAYNKAIQDILKILEE